jgi:L-seryl-tRNA(Ser) seleniumtransferase
MSETDDPRPALGLRRVINAAGTMTALGASAAVPEAIDAAAGVLPWFVETDDLQRRASRVIAAATGAEAGFVTASASAGVTLCVAAAMTGADLERIGRLPDAAGMKHRVAIQRGHLVDYGAPLDQAIRLAGARVVPVGAAAGAKPDDLAAALDETTAAAVYVVSHHVGAYASIPLASFAAICAERNVPVIVDAASEQDLTGFVAAGADLVVYSAHKFLGGLTAGIVAGRKVLVRAAYLQNLGIGRGMKVGKEGMVGAVAALEAWSRRDHAAHRRREDDCVRLWTARLDGVPGLRVEPAPDPTGNPITRLRVFVDADSGTTAWELADALAAGERPVMVRDDERKHGFFELDPCNLRDGEAEAVAERLATELARLRTSGGARATFADWRARRIAVLFAWPDDPAGLNEHSARR